MAEDCPAKAGEIPPDKGTGKTVANIQFELLKEHPYELLSDDVLFRVHALRNQINPQDENARVEFFSKSQACLRCSPLAKRYGWGLHFDAEGKIALHPMESADYARLARDGSLTQVKAMRSKRAKQQSPG